MSIEMIGSFFEMQEEIYTVFNNDSSNASIDQYQKLERIIDWEFLEEKIQPLPFFQEKEKVTMRVIISLLYVKVMENLSAEETIRALHSRSDLQVFCGITADQAQSFRASMLLIWEREISSSGNLNIMAKALTNKKIKRVEHNLVEEELSEVIRMGESDMNDYLRKEGLDPDDLVTRTKQYWKELSTKKKIPVK